MDGATGALENVETFSAILNDFRQQFPDNTLVLSSGDNFIPGPRFYAAADTTNDEVLGIAGNGRADIALLNAMGFQASALGNHELDRGTEEFASIIAAEIADGAAYAGSMFPYLSANLDFAPDENLQPLVMPDGQEASLAANSLARSAIITVQGERIGIVGATTPSVSTITAAGDIGINPADSSDVDGLAAIIQQSVDRLVAEGVNKIILLAHMQQITIEKALASRLAHVDIIVAGGSNTILADENDRLRPGDTAADTYPLHLTSTAGEPVLLVNTDADYRYLGRLVVGFDEEGVVAPESVDPSASGVYATDDGDGPVTAEPPIPEVSRIVDSLRGVLQSRDGNVLGKTDVYLAGERKDIRTQETNLGNLIADAFLWQARQVDPDVAVSLKNGGGIRDDIGQVVQPPGTLDPTDVVRVPPPANLSSGKQAGDISQFDIESVLRFNNGLSIMAVTARQLVEILEHSIGFDDVGTAWAGRFPQIGGMRFSFDPARPAGQRIRSLAIVDDGGNVIDGVVEEGVLIGNADREIKIVTMNFLANGGDGYPFTVPSPGRVDLPGEAAQTNAPNPDFPDANGNGVIDEPVSSDAGLAGFAPPGTEQDALAEYLAHFYSANAFNNAETSPLDDQRIQNLGLPGKRDTVFADTATETN